MREIVLAIASLAGAAVLTALAVFLQPDSPFWKYLLWSGIAIFAACAFVLLIDFFKPGTNIYTLSGLGVGLALTIGCAIAIFFVPSTTKDALQETEIHGWLLPANEPTPVNPLLPNGEPQGAYILLLAGGGAVLSRSEVKFTALKIGENRAILMQKTPEGLLINVKLVDALGNLAVLIEDNEWRVIPSQTSYSKRPDRSTLVVYDKGGNEVLWVRYLNKKTVRIRGVFHLLGNATPIIVTDDAVHIGNHVMQFPSFIAQVTQSPGTAFNIVETSK